MPRCSNTNGANIRSWLSLMAQKNGNSAEAPLNEDVPNFGNRNPVWRSRRIAAAKNGNQGISGMLRTQNDALLPYTNSFRSAVADPKRKVQAGGSSSHVVNAPRRTR